MCLDASMLKGTDRTDDLFHAMECFKSQIIDGIGLMSRYSRQNRYNRRYLLPKCSQICEQWATGLIVWDQPKLDRSAPSISRTTCCEIDGVTFTEAGEAPDPNNQCPGSKSLADQGSTGNSNGNGDTTRKVT